MQMFHYFVLPTYLFNLLSLSSQGDAKGSKDLKSSRLSDSSSSSDDDSGNEEESSSGTGSSTSSSSDEEKDGNKN